MSFEVRSMYSHSETAIAWWVTARDSQLSTVSNGEIGASLIMSTEQTPEIRLSDSPGSQKLTGLCIRKRFVFVPRDVAGMERDRVSQESPLRCKAAVCNRARPSHNAESPFRTRCSDPSCCIQTDEEAVAKHSLVVGPPSNSEGGPLGIGPS